MHIRHALNGVVITMIVTSFRIGLSQGTMDRLLPGFATLWGDLGRPPFPASTPSELGHIWCRVR